MTLYRSFPNFRGETLPDIPRDWRGIHYKNDACPSWETPNGLRVFVDHENPDLRECPQWNRFSVQTEDGDTILDTDDWNAALEAVRNYSV